jgi:hypothetical protein
MQLHAPLVPMRGKEQGVAGHRWIDRLEALARPTFLKRPTPFAETGVHEFRALVIPVKLPRNLWARQSSRMHLRGFRWRKLKACSDGQEN